MKEQISPAVNAHLLRGAFYVSLILVGILLPFLRAEAPAKVSYRTLTFAERVAYQRAIEEVYWRHRIWPEQRPDAKPSLDAVMSQARLEKKVEDYLSNSKALEGCWQKAITPEQLQAEMDRIAQDTKQSEVLRELFEALENDPFVIAECLARPVLTERLLNNPYERVDRSLGQRTEVGLKESSPVNAENQMSDTVTAPDSGYRLPTIADVAGNCTIDTWIATAISPAARDRDTAVWTGTEMIVWGGENLTGYGLNTGGRYNPSTDSWAATSMANAPTPRADHTAVWTGSEMIVWGGVSIVDNHGTWFNTGGRYNPGTDSWTATSTANAPTPRADHTAVWTGSEMIVWGGDNSFGLFNTGGKYDPSTDSWSATSTANAPDPRNLHTEVWAGDQMIVWGGCTNTPYYCETNTGGRYNPSTDSWTATSLTNAPEARDSHTAVWTGTEMIVWGGTIDTSGGRYNPSTDSWTATSTTNAPDWRHGHTAVWTGSDMIVWGGEAFSSLNTGGRYNPATDNWRATSTTNAPEGRLSHTAVWTGSEMIVWGGHYATPNGDIFLNTGGRYCAQPSGPVAQPATFVASNSFTANWSSVNGATYQLDVATNSSFTAYVPNYHDLNVDNRTSYAVTGLNPNTVYYYRVRAVQNGMLTSGNSNTVQVTTLRVFALVLDDFNNDGHPDYLLFNSTTRTVIWYMNNNVHVTGATGPTLPASWSLVSVADFNLDGHPDYLLFNPTTRRTVIWYMNKNVHVSGIAGPRLPGGWEVVAAADFNQDGHPDYLLFNPTTRGTVIWYMNRNVHVSGAVGPTLPAGWSLVGVADFNGDGHPDFLLFNPSTLRTVIWYMNNNVHVTGASGPTLPAGWSVIAP